MALFEGKTPAERNKTIAALALGAIALLVLGRMFFGSSSAPTQSARPTPTPKRSAPQATTATASADADADFVPTRVVFERTPAGPVDSGRNIFAYYVAPVAAPKGGLASAASPTPPPATPTPTPPLVLAGLSPQSVYARTSGFTLQVSGDKFTPATRLYFDGQEVPTQFRSPQQLTATVPAAIIVAPGTRQVVARTPDNQLFSNNATLNVMAPPVPTYTYVGLIGRKRPNGETAVLKNQKGDLVSVQVNDMVEGRFRVVGISERAVELMDKDLSIKHTLPYIDARTSALGGQMPRPIGAIPPPPQPVKPDEDTDEEPQ